MKYPSSPVRLYVVWFDMLPRDSRKLVDTRVLDDPRATNYYDPQRVVGSWFADHLGEQGKFGIAWDIYFLYGSGATWSTEPGPLLSSGSTVIGSSGELAAAFHKLGP